MNSITHHNFSKAESTATLQRGKGHFGRWARAWRAWPGHGNSEVPKVPHEMLNEKYTQPNQWLYNWNKHHELMNSCWNFFLKCLLSSIEWLEILPSLWVCLARDSDMQQSPLHEPFKQCCYASVSSFNALHQAQKSWNLHEHLPYESYTICIHTYIYINIYLPYVSICILHRYSKTYMSYVFCP